MVHLNYRQCWFFHRDNVDGVFASSYIHPYDSEKRCLDTPPVTFMRFTGGFLLHSAVTRSLRVPSAANKVNCKTPAPRRLQAISL